MWRLYHKLFGWDYVTYIFGYDMYIGRIHKTPNGKEYIRTMMGMEFLDTLPPHRGIFHLTRKGE